MGNESFYNDCSKSHRMISFESRRQLIFPLLIGKAQKGNGSFREDRKNQTKETLW